MKQFFTKRSLLFLVLASIFANMGVAAPGAWNAAKSLPAQEGKEAVTVQVSYPQENIIVLRYSLPKATIKKLGSSKSKDEVVAVLQGNALPFTREGEPVLPVVPGKFIVPANQTIDQIAVSKGKRTTLAGTYLVEHGQAPIPLIPDVKRVVTKPDLGIYSSDKVYPAKPYSLVSVQKKQGIAIGVMTLHPCEYRPKSGKLSFYTEMTITITCKPDVKLQKKRGVPISNYLKRIGRIRRSHLGVENPDLLSTYFKRSRAPEIVKSTGSQIVDPKEQYQYVAITSTSLINAKADFTINDLIAHKQNKGISAIVVSVEDIYEDESYDGVDDAEKIRNFIIDAYENWKTEYILLGGDVNIIPVRYLSSGAGGGTQIPSDVYYQCLDGNYNSDGDNYWGEPTDGPEGQDVDLLADVYIGRASVEDEKEMANFVFKTLKYENESSAASYLSQAVMIGEFLGGQFGPDEFSYAIPLMQEIHHGSEAASYTTVGFDQYGVFSVDSIYEYVTKWSGVDLIEYINENNCGVINHLGHANTNYVMKLTNEDVEGITNTNNIFAYSQGCLPGDFPLDCIAERLTTSSRTGCFAVVFNSRYGWGAYNDNYENLDAPSQRFNRQFWHAFFGEFIMNLGAINAYSHEQNIWDINGTNIRWCFYESNLFGDPQTMLRGLYVGPSLIYAAHSIDDESSGNGDGYANPGEKLSLPIIVKNVGSEPSLGVTATISSDDPSITIETEFLEFGDVPCCGATKRSIDGASISISSSCETPALIPIRTVFTDSEQNTWESTFELPVYTSTSIKGMVTTISGNNPIAGAKVGYTGTKSGEVTTDSEGNYSIRVIDGTYELTISAEGYLPEVSEPISVPPDVEDLNFTLGRPQIAVTPVSFKEAIVVGDSLVKDFTVVNNGDLPMKLKLRTKASAKPVLRLSPQLIPGQKFDGAPLSKQVTNLKEKSPNLKPDVPALVGGASILYLNTLYREDDVEDDFIRGLRELENVDSVKVLSAVDKTPNLDYLLGYPIVIVAADYRWADPELVGETLADYVDEGGKVILLGLSFVDKIGYGLGGRIIEPEYLPLKTGTLEFGATATTFEEHPITEELELIYSDIVVNTSSAQGLGVLLGNYDNEVAFGAYNPNKPVVALNVFPLQFYWDGDVIRLMGNTINWLGNGLWLRLGTEENEYSINPEESITVPMVFSAANLFGGTYTGTIVCDHNDPTQEPPLVVPCTLYVEGDRCLTAKPMALDFRRVWQNTPATLPITLENPGTEVTRISELQFSEKVFSHAEELPLSLLPQEKTTIYVIFTPKELGEISGELTIVSDAEDNPSIAISLQGEGVVPPIVSVDPPSLSFNLDPKEMPVDKTFTIFNSGGDILAYQLYAKETGSPEIQSDPKRPALPGIDGSRIYNSTNYSQPFVPGDLIVALHEGRTITDVTTLTQLSLASTRQLALAKSPKTKKLVYTGRPLYLLTLTNTANEAVLNAISALKADPAIAYAEPNYIRQAVAFPNDPDFNKLYGMHNIGQTGGTVDADIDAVEAWDMQKGSKKVIIGLIDTGVDYLHPDLADNMWKNPGEVENGIDDDGNGFVDDIYGWDFPNRDNDPMDDHGHGTHCAGIVAGVGSNDEGVCGVMWQAQIMAIKFLGLGGGSTADAIESVNYATAMGAHLSSNSWGGGPFSQALLDAISQSCLFVAAAGNYRSDNDKNPFYPASYVGDNIISVAATDHNDDLASFSNYGLTTVDVAAPGVDIYSSLPGKSYGFNSGTSMAAPHVSGVVGLLFSANPSLTGQQAKEILLETVDPLASLEGKMVTGGRINAYKAVKDAGPAWLSLNPFEPGEIAPDGEQVITVTADPKGLRAGEWTADIMVETNDPENGTVTVPVLAIVAPCKSLYAESETITFGDVWNDRDSLSSLTVVNECNETVTITALTLDNAVYTTSLKVPAYVEPFGTLEIPVRFQPIDPVLYEGAFSIISDAEDNSVIDVALSGKGVLPPKIAVDPESLLRQLNPSVLDTAIVTIENSGGAAYRFEIDVEFFEDEEEKEPKEPRSLLLSRALPVRLPLQKNMAAAAQQYKNLAEEMRSTVVKPVEIQSLGSYSLDRATLFACRESRAGSHIVQLDPETGETIGDSIPTEGFGGPEGLAYDGEYLYYIHGVNAVAVIDPESGVQVAIIECQIPEVGYDGLGVSKDYLICYNYHEGALYVVDKESGELVSRWDVGDRGRAGSVTYAGDRNTVFVANNSIGMIEERDLMEGTVLNSFEAPTPVSYGLAYSVGAKVLFISDFSRGISIVDPDDGSLISALPKATYIWGLAADEAQGNAWIDLSAKEGVVPAGESFELKAIFNTEMMVAGDYAAKVHILHKPEHGPGPQATVHCELTVNAVKMLAIEPVEHTFDTVWVGLSETTLLTLVNNGNAPTAISDITLPNRHFRLGEELPLEVPPFGKEVFELFYEPKWPGKHKATVTVKSDATDNPSTTATIRGKSVRPPRITVFPNKLKLSSDPGKTKTFNVRLINTGGAAFEFTTRAKEERDNPSLATGNLADAQLFGAYMDSIYQIDPESGEKVGEPIIVEGKNRYDQGLAFDGEYVYYLTTEYSDTAKGPRNLVLAIDPETGIQERKLELSVEGLDYFFSLGVSNDHFYTFAFGKDPGTKCCIIDKESGELINMLSFESYPYSLTYGGDRQSFFMTTYDPEARQVVVEEREHMTGELKNAFPIETRSYGLAYSTAANALFVVDYGIMVVLDPDEGTVVAEYEVSDIYSLAADEVSGSRWLSVGMKEGVVPAMRSIKLPVTFTIDSLFPGTYKGAVTISHKRDVAPGPFTISCVLKVRECGRIAIQPKEVDFGYVEVGVSAKSSLTLTNSGNRPVNIKKVISSNKRFEFIDEIPYFVDPFSQVTATVAFTPTKLKKSEALMIFVSDASNKPIHFIKCKGEGIEPEEEMIVENKGNE